MRHEAMPSDLAILSAEQYFDGSFTGEAGKAKKPSTSQPKTSPRKRAKISPPAVETESAEDGDDDGAKRARGRPRLDTKDQTAAETLERRVQELEENNEELSAVFLKLHDSAVNLGVLEQAPGFALELRAATEKILSLARKSSEDDGQDEQAESSAAERPAGQTRTEHSSSSDVAEVQPTRNPTVPIWGGYMVNTEPQAPPSGSMSMPSSNMLQVTQAPLGYEIVTMPTFENASFPFDLSPDSPYPNIFDQASTSSSSYPLSPYSALPLPQSMAFSESTLGRRLQRSAVELAHRLITMPDPPKHRYAEVFGFCMLFEPIDKIRERLAKALERTASESLNWWQAPFWAAGGSGQHQLQLQQGNNDHGGSPVGNQGTTDHMKYSFSGGQFGLGPFDAKVAETRDKRIDPRMRIRLPGFEGDFYDPEEVELYLQARGVIIQPGQDYLTTEVDVAAFRNGMIARQGSQGQAPKQTTTGFGDWPQTLDEAFNTPAPAGPSPGASSGMASASSSSDPSSWPIADFPEMFNPAAAGAGISGLGGSGPAGPESSRKRLVTLDVNVFIRELSQRGTCLGRSPGFRPKDVDAAFWTATKTDAVLGF
ncbi:BZIP family transcription factor [Diaporthe amygdali]|uniref:BZIP family transcription factor n=1 Tax=Phomopsis amygdali TaxID=1214568 RepID=UPI0022FECA7C|nr:BZIP family transcription factor [Diaporthe amygdali]KAJ0119725.1 BZIP family transcription factor [Diaporthe amygdali]